MILKANLHFHTAEDPKAHKDHITYSIYQGIDYAKKLNFQVLALTCHEKFVYQEKMGQYSQRQGMLLIPGIEAKIEERHIVILNCSQEIEKIKTLEELRNYKKEHPEIFILAPHPFFPLGHSLMNKLEKNIDIFDALEYSWYWNKWIDCNKKTKKIAQKYNLPYLATSDTHCLTYLDKSYSFIEAEKLTKESILAALKKGKFKNKSQPLKWSEMISVGFHQFF